MRVVAKAASHKRAVSEAEPTSPYATPFDRARTNSDGSQALDCDWVPRQAFRYCPFIIGTSDSSRASAPEESLMLFRADNASWCAELRAGSSLPTATSMGRFSCFNAASPGGVSAACRISHDGEGGQIVATALRQLTHAACCLVNDGQRVIR